MTKIKTCGLDGCERPAEDGGLCHECLTDYLADATPSKYHDHPHAQALENEGYCRVCDRVREADVEDIRIDLS